MRATDLFRSALLAAVLVSAASCTYYVAPGATTVTAPASFDRSWSAAVGALQDQGVEISVEDRASGMIRGRRGGIDVIANVRSQADGSVRVQFDSSGATAQDPTLLQRVSSSYDRRMGR
jgi:hypothetical protein